MSAEKLVRVGIDGTPVHERRQKAEDDHKRAQCSTKYALHDMFFLFDHA